MALIRVFMLPEATGKFLHGGGAPATFMQVDWFDDGPPAPADFPDVGSDEWKGLLTGFIRQKRYFVPGRAYLVLHPEHTFTIDYRA